MGFLMVRFWLEGEINRKRDNNKQKKWEREGGIFKIRFRTSKLEKDKDRM